MFASRMPLQARPTVGGRKVANANDCVQLTLLATRRKRKSLSGQPGHSIDKVHIVSLRFFIKTRLPVLVQELRPRCFFWAPLAAIHRHRKSRSEKRMTCGAR